MSRSTKATAASADTAKESVNSVQKELDEYQEGEAQARSGARRCNVEDAKPVAPSQPTIVLASNCNVKDAAELKQSLCQLPR